MGPEYIGGWNKTRNNLNNPLLLSKNRNTNKEESNKLKYYNRKYFYILSNIFPVSVNQDKRNNLQNILMDDFLDIQFIQ